VLPVKNKGWQKSSFIYSEW